MICVCPKCGKQVEMSPQALADQGGVVVCPKCLCEYTGTLEPLPQPRHRRHADEPEEQTVVITLECTRCGRGLADDMNFCPYCGKPVAEIEGEIEEPEPEPQDEGEEDDDLEFTPYPAKPRRRATGRTPVIRRHTPIYAYILIVLLSIALFALILISNK
ncbi:MAG: zinc-ribbon domain-containing protein [Muribaculaceae bacterium]|nr:zinc-ribbon domain-containing protein [Muribaculaceae bacterium]